MEAAKELRAEEARAAVPLGCAVSGGGAGGGAGGGTGAEAALVTALKEVTDERAGAKPKVLTGPEIVALRNDFEAEWNPRGHCQWRLFCVCFTSL